MNIALPALVILLLLMPGFIIRSRFKIVERQSLDYSPFGLVFTEGITWAIALHTIWLAISLTCLGYTFQIENLLYLISADPNKTSIAISFIKDKTELLAFYFLSLYATCYTLPPIIRLIISGLRVDKFESKLSWIFRFHKAPWYYLLSGADFDKDEKPDLVAVSAIVDVAGSPYLYTGQLDEYYLDENGKLDRLILSNTMRRTLDKDKSRDNGELIEDRFYPIDGDYFVLRYDEAITLNIRYIKLNVLD